MRHRIVKFPTCLSHACKTSLSTQTYGKRSSSLFCASSRVTSTLLLFTDILFIYTIIALN